MISSTKMTRQAMTVEVAAITDACLYKWREADEVVV